MTDAANLLSPYKNLAIIWGKIRAFLNSRYAIIALILLGIIRVIIALLAYSPADGADASDYYLHAAYLSGADIPADFASFSPLFPLLVAVSYYGLGNFWLILIVQWLMSIGQGLLYFLGLRGYSPLFAFLIAPAIIVDMQMAVMFNFASTEPIYMFLLAAAYALLLTQVKRENIRHGHWGDVLFAVTLVALALARPVAQFIFVPFIVIFLMGTRNFWRTGLVLLSYLLIFFAFNIGYDALFFSEDDIQPVAANSVMISRPLLELGLLYEDSGEFSANLAHLVADCPSTVQARTSCLIEAYGSRQAYSQVLRSAFIEMLQAHSVEYLGFLFDGFSDFLRLTGQQFRDGVSPADVQCADLGARSQRTLQTYLEVDWLVVEISPELEIKLAKLIDDFTAQMCPPAQSNLTIRQIVDWIAFRYRSISRPNPYLWVAVLTILILILPRVRPLWLPLLAAAGLLSYHAAISAVILNVQERYVIVTNPFKTILVLATIVVTIYAIGRGIQILAKRYFSKLEG
jgi:hypothetical protein